MNAPALSLSVFQQEVSAEGVLNWRDRLKAYGDVIEQHRPDVPLSILEIGVFHGLLAEALLKRFAGRIERYIGVDPYIGDDTDPYFKAYWKGQKSVAESTYEQAKARIVAAGGALICATSMDYLKNCRDVFPVIIIDGDHREGPAYDDLNAAWPLLPSKGLMIADDFANPDHPGVTAAALRFDKQKRGECEVHGCHYSFFHKPPERLLPYPLGLAWWVKR